MLARVQSYLLQGIDAVACEVEVDVDLGAVKPDSDQPRPTVVGLPDTAVKESVERVRSALGNSGFKFPQGKVVVNLAPAHLRKEGPMYDLPIAVGMLIADGVIDPGEAPSHRVQVALGRRIAPSRAAAGGAKRGNAGGPSDAGDLLGLGEDGAADDDAAPSGPIDPRQFLFAGELALDGRLRPVRGVIAMAALAKSRGMRGVVVPRENAPEAAVVPGVEAVGVSTLAEVVGMLTGALPASSHAPVDVEAMLLTAEAPVDFVDVRGQEAVKRAIVIAAAGSHNLLMLGPAGTGKTMMARALPGVLPPLTPEEAIEITRIYSAAGQMPPGQGLVTTRPVRSPHHTSSAPAIVGGGMVPRPGEISLAHRGVLFLDELPEFDRDVLETMRQPLEDHVVTIARAHSAVRFPASFMLVAAMNPTPKGDIPRDEFGKRAMDRYLAKLSGPLIDRIDLHVEAPAVPWKQLSSAPIGTSSKQMREQVLAARERQNARQGTSTQNSRLSGRQLDKLARMSEDAQAMLGQAMTELGLSARAYDKIRRVSRTIADIEGAETIGPGHIAEAVSYRLLDRKS
jgi:magnesium chelatase family protein